MMQPAVSNRKEKAGLVKLASRGTANALITRSLQTSEVIRVRKWESGFGETIPVLPTDPQCVLGPVI